MGFRGSLVQIQSSRPGKLKDLSELAERCLAHFFDFLDLLPNSYLTELVRLFRVGSVEIMLCEFFLQEEFAV
jgi:hypothetical protein